MAQGKPSKWATATIKEPVALGKAGITVVVWDKWGRKRKGTLVVSIGGIRWRPYKIWKKSKVSRRNMITWKELDGIVQPKKKAGATSR